MALVPSLVFSRALYSRTGSPSLCRPFSRFALHAAAVALALTAGGCSFSYQLDSLFEKGKETASAETTGSTRNTPASVSAKPQPADRDLAYARAAAAEVLRQGGSGVSQSWENPETGARGTVTPIASAYNNDDGFTCQDFLASYVRAGSGEDWMRGEACRLHKGNWEVRSLKPWKSS